MDLFEGEKTTKVTLQCEHFASFVHFDLIFSSSMCNVSQRNEQMYKNCGRTYCVRWAGVRAVFE